MYSDYGKASVGRRYLTGFIDLILVFTLSIILYLFVGYPIGKSSCDFDENVLYQKQLTLDIYEHMYETRLYVKGSNDEALGAKEIYDLYVKELLDNQEKDENGDYKNMFAYYYINYAQSMSVSQFNNEILKIDTEDSLFTYRNGNSNLVGTLKSEIYSLINQYTSGVINEKTDNANNKLSYHFQKQWLQAVENEKKSEFMVDTIKKFNDSLYKQGYGIGIPAIIIYVIFMIIFTLIIPLCLKGDTLGNKIAHTKTLTIKNTRPKAIAICVRSLILVIMNIYISFVCLMMITGIENACKVPLFQIGDKVIPLATVSFTLILLGLVNLFMLSFNKRHQSYGELITSTYCSDYVNIEKISEENANKER